MFKYIDGVLDTGSYNGSYARKPPARTYNSLGPTKAQWQLFHKQGYTARAAEIVINDDGSPGIEWIDQDWVPKTSLCKFHKYGQKCTLRKDHDGIHLVKPR